MRLILIGTHRRFASLVIGLCLMHGGAGPLGAQEIAARPVNVYLTAKDVVIRDEAGAVVPMPPLGDRYRLDRVEADRVWIVSSSGRTRGWVRPDDIVKQKEAVAYFARQIEVSRNPYAYYMQSQYNMRSKVAFRWGLSLRPDSQEFKWALEDIDEAIRLDPTVPGYFNCRADLHSDAGDHDRAIADANEGLRLCPKDSSERSSLLLRRALQYQRIGDNDKALADLDEILRLDPKNGWYRELRADSLAAKGNLDGAIEECNKALAMHPKAPAWLDDRGRAWLAKGEIDKAFEDFDLAVKTLPIDPESRALRGRARAARGEYAEAASDFEAALRKEGLLAVRARPMCLLSLSHFLATCPDASRRDGKRAVALAEEAVQLVRGKDAIVLDVLAAGHAELGDFDRAITLETEGIALLRPGDPRLVKLREHLALYREKHPLRDIPKPR